jgi:hypothetical protein
LRSHFDEQAIRSILFAKPTELILCPPTTMISLEGVRSIAIGNSFLGTSRYGRPMFRFAMIGNHLKVSTLGCDDVSDIEVLKFRLIQRSWLLDLFGTEILVYDATEGGCDTSLYLYRIKKGQGFCKKLDWAVSWLRRGRKRR